MHSSSLFRTGGRSGAFPRWAGVIRWLVALTFLTAAAGCASLPANAGRQPSRSFADPDVTPFGRLVAERKKQAGARADTGFNLLDSVDAAYGSRIALID